MDGENDRHCLKSRRIGMHIPLTSRFPSGFKKALYKWPNAVYGHMIDHSIRSNFSERVLLPGVSWCYFGWCLTRWMGAVEPINHSLGATGDLTTWFQCYNFTLQLYFTQCYNLVTQCYPIKRSCSDRQSGNLSNHHSLFPSVPIQMRMMSPCLV